MAVESFNPIQLQAFVAFKIQGHPQLVSKVGSGRNAIVLRLIVPTRQPQQLTWLAWIQQRMSLCLMIKREREKVLPEYMTDRRLCCFTVTFTTSRSMILCFHIML